MSQHARTAKRFALTLLGSVFVLGALGATIAALTGRDVWRSMMWTLIIGGGVLIVLNVAGSGSGRALADPRTGFALGGTVHDAATSARSLVAGLILVGLGVGGLVA